ncbi:ATP-binding protein [Psychrobacter sp. W2-37-MNA-CIBAN-0211]|uniref:ATP-binding protein n=1 Tax=Psychrobacter sp. W2-37-MNA-CIBAN-0211 TaxID=3140443 RepID=UPI0033271E8C
MNTQTLDRRAPTPANLSSFHTAHHGKSLSQLMAQIPADITLHEIKADCVAHGKHTWKISQRAYDAGETGCPKCKSDLDERRNKFIAGRRQLLNNIDMPIEHINADFSSWSVGGSDDIQARQDKIIAFAESYAKSYAKGHANILLSGSTGTGKTKLACLIANEIVRRAYRPSMTVLFKRSEQIQQEIKDTWKHNSPVTKKAYLDMLSRAAVLVIDEVGEADTGFSEKASDADRETLSALIDRRYQKGLPTIITTNLSPDEFYEQLGHRGSDRIRQNLVSINCVWESYREVTSQLLEL